MKKTTGSQLESALKIWVQVKATNDSIEIDLGKKKPAQFESKEQELEWDRTSAKNALKFKQLVESGQFIPDEIRQKLENKLKRTPEEEQILKQGLELANHREKVTAFFRAKIFSNVSPDSLQSFSLLIRCVGSRWSRKSLSSTWPSAWRCTIKSLRWSGA